MPLTDNLRDDKPLFKAHPNSRLPRETKHKGFHSQKQIITLPVKIEEIEWRACETEENFEKEVDQYVGGGSFCTAVSVMIII